MISLQTHLNEAKSYLAPPKSYHRLCAYDSQPHLLSVHENTLQICTEPFIQFALAVCEISIMFTKAIAYYAVSDWLCILDAFCEEHSKGANQSVFFFLKPRSQDNEIQKHLLKRKLRNMYHSENLKYDLSLLKDLQKLIQ